MQEKRSSLITNTKGQVAVLVAVIFTFLFLLFAMVINVGMVIHHKINLQNAADMAAYAGAAEQARILSTIAWKNFELRKNLKEFAYFYWVSHSAWNNGFPKSIPEAQGTQPQNWNPALCLNDRYPQDSICKFTSQSIPQIIEPKFMIPPYDIIVTGQARKFRERAAGICEQYGKINEEHAREDRRIYLENSQAILEQIQDLSLAINKEYEDDSTNVANHDMFESTIPQKWYHLSLANDGSYTTALPPLPKDIGTLARITALKNLSEPNRMGGFQFIPVKPEGTYDSSNPLKGPYLNLDTMTQNYYLAYKVFPSGGQICTPTPRVLPMDNFVLGVRKKESANTYYAVRLESQPWLPFLPGEIRPTLRAYAAAKPFGGRINPPEEDPLYRNNAPPGHYTTPNFSIYPNDTVGIRDRKILFDLSHWKYGGEFDVAALDASKKWGREALRAPNYFEADKYTFNLNYERVNDPRLSDNPKLLGQPTLANYNYFVVGNADTLKTGWGTRAGYSVKFVSFRDLFGYQNPPRLEDFSGDDNNILH